MQKGHNFLQNLQKSEDFCKSRRLCRKGTTFCRSSVKSEGQGLTAKSRNLQISAGRGTLSAECRNLQSFAFCRKRKCAPFLQKSAELYILQNAEICRALYSAGYTFCRNLHSAGRGYTFCRNLQKAGLMASPSPHLERRLTCGGSSGGGASAAPPPDPLPAPLKTSRPPEPRRNTCAVLLP